MLVRHDKNCMLHELIVDHEALIDLIQHSRANDGFSTRTLHASTATWTRNAIIRRRRTRAQALAQRHRSRHHRLMRNQIALDDAPRSCSAALQVVEMRVHGRSDLERISDTRVGEHGLRPAVASEAADDSAGHVLEAVERLVCGGSACAGGRGRGGC